MLTTEALVSDSDTRRGSAMPAAAAALRRMLLNTPPLLVQKRVFFFSSEAAFVEGFLERNCGHSLIMQEIPPGALS